MDRLSRFRSPDIVSGIALLALAVVYFLGSRGFPDGSDEPGPAFFPRLLAVTLALLALVVVARSFLSQRENVKSLPLTRMTRPLVLMVGSLAYVAAFSFVGFAGTSLVYAFGVVLLFPSGSRIGWIAVPIATAATLYALFELGLGVPLP